MAHSLRRRPGILIHFASARRSPSASSPRARFTSVSSGDLTRSTPHLSARPIASPSILAPPCSSSHPPLLSSSSFSTASFSSFTSTPVSLSKRKINKGESNMTMDSESFQQAPHKLLVIPGPIEFSDSVLLSNATPGTSHVSPAFIPIFGDCIRMLRDVLYSTKESASQPFLIAGSGTLGWDATAANLVEPGENVLVLNTGYFGDSFAECLEAYGANVTQLKAPIGGVATEDEIVAALKEKKYKLITITHVDTSTGVLSPAASIAKLVHTHSPSTLIALDAVCAVASEEIRFDDWGLDIVISATQKGLGVPPGLSVVLASKRAIQTFESRKAPVGAYYISWKKWLPIMNAYEEGKAAYFATPPVQLIYSLHTALTAITKSSPSLTERFAAHKAASAKVKDTLASLGLDFVPLNRDIAANGMTAVKFPSGVSAADVLPKLAKRDIVVAGGLHKAIAPTYFRIGHMGITATDSSRGDIDKVLDAIKAVLAEVESDKKST